MKYIDIGTNLYCSQFAGREDEIVLAAHENEVALIITGSSEKSSLQAANYVKDHEGVYATAGIHPHAAKEWRDDSLSKLREILRIGGDHMVAVGECGLDYDRMYSPADTQRFVFEAQLLLAEENGLPVFLHERKASADFIEILKRHPSICDRAVVHCFTGDAETAKAYLELGCMIGITGWICDERRNAELLKALDIIPVERLMAETDAPYLLPRGIHGLKNPNLPENIVYVVRALAKAKGMEEEELRLRILENTCMFFGLMTR